MMILRVSQGSFLRGRHGIVALRKAGVNVEQTETGREALAYLRLYDYDLLLIDLNLPDLPGHEVVRMIRAAGYATPIVVLADTATVEQKVRTLDQGADDFIITPCDTQELLAHLRAVLRRSQGHATSILRAGPVELRMDRREVFVNSELLPLTRREFNVLELLFLKRGVILNKTALLNHLYCGIEEPEIKSIDVTICRVRKKLAEAGVTNLIDTVWGCGYILREPEVVPAAWEAADGPLMVAA